MEPLFSRREGFDPAPAMQLMDLDAKTRTRLWNEIQHLFGTEDGNYYRNRYTSLFHTLGWNISGTRTRPYDSRKKIETHFFDCPFAECFDVLEWAFTVDTWPAISPNQINDVLAHQNVGYRVINERFVAITTPQDVQAVTDVFNAHGVTSEAAGHVRGALQKLRPSQNGALDLRGTVADAIHAVEAQARYFAGTDKGVLTDIVKNSSFQSVHPSIRKVIGDIAAYANDTSRHAKKQDDQYSPSHADAILVLVISSAVVTWLARIASGLKD